MMSCKKFIWWSNNLSFRSFTISQLRFATGFLNYNGGFVVPFPTPLTRVVHPGCLSCVWFIWFHGHPFGINDRPFDPGVGLSVGSILVSIPRSLFYRWFRRPVLCDTRISVLVILVLCVWCMSQKKEKLFEFSLQLFIYCKKFSTHAGYRTAVEGWLLLTLHLVVNLCGVHPLIIRL